MRLAAVLLFAQALTFETASIRPSRPVDGERARSPIATTPGGITARATSLGDCIQWAWGLREFQLAGPDWIDQERFDIAARSPAPATPADLRTMFQALLTARFRLQFHREKRSVAAYAITATRSPKLRPSTHDQQSMAKLPGGGLRLDFRHTTIAQLAAFLSTLAAIDRPVEDRSGVDGVYDFQLDLHEVAGPWTSDAERNAAPSFMTVIQEQLGLRLEGRRESIEVMVLDGVERPTEN
jgi:uncharacterized protein (TIGR03435 family)